MNAFFTPPATPFQTLPFGQWEVSDYLPAAKKAMVLAKERIAQLKQSSGTTFKSFILPYLESSRELDLISNTFSNLHSANTSDEMEQVALELSPLLTEFANDLLLDAQLWQSIEATYKQRDTEQLTPEEQTILEKQYQSFVRNGALLGKAEKQQLRKIDGELAKLQVAFGQNSLQAKNQFVLPLSEQDLRGVPKDSWDILRKAAQEKDLSGYALTLDFPVYVLFMKNAENRSLREQAYLAYMQIATVAPFDNREICCQVVRLRKERARLLGYPDHAAFVLEQRMAENSQNVVNFLAQLKEKALDKARDELQELTKFARGMGHQGELRPWDISFYSEKHKRKLFAFDDETLRPYFKLENVIQGVFDTASKLYQLRFRLNLDIATYHPEVKVYEVLDGESSEVCGILYADFFPRPSKRQGAWMCSYREQSKQQIPHVSIVCNFTPSTANRPSLLSHMEVLTLFHEFGHALHGLLSKCQYRILSGPQVYWDFVELPSQLMENWAFEKTCLGLFARHYQTGELISESLVAKIKQSQTFMAGYSTLRQLSLSTLDMVLHTQSGDNLTDIVAKEAEIMKEFDLLNYRPPQSCQCTNFSHIFNGGYSAGYYSYKWAEVLDADAFELFEQQGIFDPQTAKSFRDNILARGGSEHPMDLYQRFRGHRPDTSALLRRCGLA